MIGVNVRPLSHVPIRGGCRSSPPNNELTEISNNLLKCLLSVSKPFLYDYLLVTLKRLLGTLFRLLGGYGLRTALRLALALRLRRAQRGYACTSPVTPCNMDKLRVTLRETRGNKKRTDYKPFLFSFE